MEEQGMRRLGRYNIIEELGRGGHATVYRAVDTALEREVALKVLHPALHSDPAFTQRFRKEAKALASLRHPNIVVIYEVGEAEGRMFIAMDLANGTSLDRVIAERGAIPWEETKRIMQQVCAALHYAHEQGIVHRDLKPSNILLDRDRGVLLSDFGLARLIGSGGASLSVTQGILGTPAYIAPEIWDMEVATPQADVYALGCILFEMLTGKTLFSGETPVQLLHAHDRGPVFPQLWSQGIPDGIAAVLAKALARDPKERFADAPSLCSALEGLETQAADQQARAAQDTAARWKTEAEHALAQNNWTAAAAAVSRWLAAQPGNPQALALQQAVERRRIAVEQAQRQREEPSQPKPDSQEQNRKPAPRPNRVLLFSLLGIGTLACVILFVVGLNLLQGLTPEPTAISEEAVTQEATPTNSPEAPIIPTATTTPPQQPSITPFPTHTAPPAPTTVADLDPLQFMVHYYDLLARDECREAYAQLSDRYKESIAEGSDPFVTYQNWCIDVQHVEFLERDTLEDVGHAAYVRIVLEWTFPNNQIIHTRPMRVGLVRDLDTRQWLIDTSVFVD